MGIPVEYSFHEDAPGQQEIDLRHTDALTMADSVMTFRLAVREIAARNGAHATFMPKPLEGVQGSGMHVHLSLFEGDDNAFFDADDSYNLSAKAKAFMAGLLRHAPEITAVTNQTVNSYKRLVPGFEAPVHLSWARNNRSGLIRVPIAKNDNPLATRLEYRSPDPACNPYLAFSLMLAAGMKGIEEGYSCPTKLTPTCSRSATRCSSSSASASSRTSLAAALETMERSTLVREALGEHIYEWFLRSKRIEWRDYKTHVSAVRARSVPDVVVSRAQPDASGLPGPGADPNWRARSISGVLRGRPFPRPPMPVNTSPTWLGRNHRRCHDDPEGAWAFLRAIRKQADEHLPVIVLIGGAQLAELEHRDDLFDDFCLSPFHPSELEARLQTPALGRRCRRQL